MGNRSSLIILPITIALIAFVAFSIWIWLSFEKEKSIYGERMAILATGIAYPFDMVMRDMLGELAAIPSEGARATDLAAPSAPSLVRLKVRTARYTASDADDPALPAALTEALREAAGTEGIALSAPFVVEGEGGRAAMVAARRGKDDRLTDFAAVSFSTDALADWWALMRRPLDIGVAAIRPGGGVWLSAFLGEDFAANQALAAGWEKSDAPRRVGERFRFRAKARTRF